MERRIICLVISVLLLCGAAITVHAQDYIDFSKKGSIEVTMQMSGEAVPGGTLTLYRVAEIYEEDNHYAMRLTDDFQDSSESLEDIQKPELADRLEEYAQNLQGITKEIGQIGNVIFEELELGLYLVVQKEAAPGYNRVRAFLVSVPELVQGEYIYQIDAGPKVALIPTTTLPPTVQPTTQPTKQPNATSTVMPGEKIPQTGQLNWPIPLMAVLGLWMFSVGWILCFGQKKDKHEK